MSYVDPLGLMGRGAGKGPYAPGTGPGSFPPSTITITVHYGLPNAPIKPPETGTYSTACLATFGIVGKGVGVPLLNAGVNASPELAARAGAGEAAVGFMRGAAAAWTNPVTTGLFVPFAVDEIAKRCECSK